MDISQLPTIVGQTIDTLASKLAVPTQQLLDMAVNGTRAEGIVLLAFAATKFAVAGYIASKCSTIQKEDVKDCFNVNVNMYPDRKWWGFALAIGIAILASVFAYFGALMAFAPEYSLLKSILKF